MSSPSRITVFVALAALFSIKAYSQGSVSISAVPAQNVTLENHLAFDSLKYYPYCTVSISVFNFDRLNKKEFRSQSSRLESFALNAGIEGKTICADKLNVPVFVVNYEKGKYTRITHQQGVLIHKLLINKDATDYPTVSIYPKTIDKDKSAFYIQTLQQVATLLKNTTSLNLVANVSNITDAFSQYIGSLCTEEESDYEWSFPVMPATDITRPYKVDMFVLKPNSKTYAGQKFIIRNNEAWQENADAPYTRYPYILVTTSFSGYLADEKLPSTLPAESLDRLTLDASRVKLYADINRLSKEQFDAESRLLNKYENYLAIKELSGLVSQYPDNDEVKTNLLNAWFMYRQDGMVCGHFYDTDVFAAQLARLDGYVANLTRQAGFYNLMNEFMNAYLKCSDAYDKPSLAAFYRYQDIFAAKNFIRNSQVYSSLRNRIAEMEAVDYQEHYAADIITLRSMISEERLTDKEKLQNGEQTYSRLYQEMKDNECRACTDSIFKVVSAYNELDNNKLSVARTLDIINVTRYIDTLQAFEGHLEADMKDPGVKPDKKKMLRDEKERLETEARAMNDEKNVFMATPLQHRPEFRTEKSKIEGEMEEAVKMLREVRQKT